MDTDDNPIFVDPLLSDYIIAADGYFSPGSGAAEKCRYFKAVELLEALPPQKLSDFADMLDEIVFYLETSGVYGENGIDEIRTDFITRFAGVLYGSDDEPEPWVELEESGIF